MDLNWAKAAQTSRDELWHPGWLETDGEPCRLHLSTSKALQEALKASKCLQGASQRCLLALEAKEKTIAKRVAAAKECFLLEK